jgi:hypothetical protein
MTTKTVEGREVRYWDFDRQIEKDGAKVTEPGWVKQPSAISYARPDSLPEAMEVTNGNEDRLLDLIEKGLQAEAEERAGSTPAGTFSVSMVQAADRALRFNPEFAKLKSSKERREAIMRYIGSVVPMRDAFLVAFEGQRNAKADTEDSE